MSIYERNEIKHKRNYGKVCNAVSQFLSTDRHSVSPIEVMQMFDLGIDSFVVNTIRELSAVIHA